MAKQKRDWVGGNASVFKTIGASNHGNEQREQHDYYATDPKSVEALLRVERFAPKVWEPACGEGNISHTLMAHGYEVRESDIIDRMDNEVKDFLFFNEEKWNGDIVTNPPYSMAKEFVEQSLSCIPMGNKVAMFLKLTFLEGKARRELFRIAPPIRIYVFTDRQVCPKNNDFAQYGMASAVCFAWFIWEKGLQGKPTIDWL